MRGELYESLPAETRLTVYRRLQVRIGHPLMPRRLQNYSEMTWRAEHSWPQLCSKSNSAIRANTPLLSSARIYTLGAVFRICDIVPNSRSCSNQFYGNLQVLLQWFVTLVCLSMRYRQGKEVRTRCQMGVKIEHVHRYMKIIISRMIRSSVK